MKRLFFAAFISVLLTVAITLHCLKIKNISNTAEVLTSQIYTELSFDNWDNINTLTDELYKLWYGNKLWASATLRSNQIDEIEISLEQCRQYLTLEAKEEFVGELTMFCHMIEHLREQEGVALGELL